MIINAPGLRSALLFVGNGGLPPANPNIPSTIFTSQTRMMPPANQVKVWFAGNISPSETSIKARLAKMRKLMRENNIDAYWVPSADEHLNEYLPEHLLRRPYMSDFTGSEGEFIVTHDKAYLVVDGRYHNEADRDVNADHVEVVKAPGALNWPGVEGLVKQLSEETPGFTLGIDPFVTTSAKIERLKTIMRGANVNGIVRKV